MRWSKIKNIIILLLLLVNGFLLAQVGLRAYRSQQARRETRERMVAILERNDMAFLPEEVPGDLELTGRRVTLSPFGETEAAVLLGQVFQVQTQGAQTLYTGLEGTAAITAAGELTVEFLPNNTLQKGDVVERLSKLGIRLQPMDKPGEEGDTARYALLWDNTPVLGETALMSFYGSSHDKIRTLTFRFLTGTEEVLPAQETLDAATALTRLLDELNRGEGYVCSQISAIYPGYLLSGTGPLTLTPAWFIETDTWHFAVDGYTGVVTAAE